VLGAVLLIRAFVIRAAIQRKTFAAEMKSYPFPWHIFSILIFITFFLFQISFFSTSPELSNKQRFEYFSRTIPSDHYQTLAMTKIVVLLGWKYISIVYEESNYGIKVS
jgi:hypothetical protein